MIENPLIKQQVEKGMQDAIKDIDHISSVFLDPSYDMNTVIEYEADFILGAVLCQVVNNTNRNLIGIQIEPTQEEFNQINQFVFSQSATLKENIKKIVGV